MNGHISEEVILEVREKTDIVQIIGQYVQLKRAGVNFKGLCPFHEEKTPSFNVNPSRQFFHCFGCQESGDVFAFLMKIEGRKFGEVVEDLAALAGVEIKRTETPAQAKAAAQRKSERQQGLDLNARVAKLYQKCLSQEGGGEALNYLKKRGINREVSEKFQLGFSPSQGNLIVRLLEQNKIPMEFGERMGLVAKRRNAQGFHDRFWNRLMFPLVGVRGEIFGFGGRLLSGTEGPKYVNTPETNLYTKGATLYGLHTGANAIRQKNLALIVEGNFDVIQMYQAGFENTVAPMGTALTESQIRLLRRFCNEVIAIFDGDQAGRAAARKAVGTLVRGGVEAKIATLPDGEDPDSLLLSSGAEVFQQVLDQAIPALDYLLSELCSQSDDTIPGRAKVLENIAPLVNMLESRVTQELYVDRLAMVLSIDRATAARAVRSGQKGGISLSGQIEDKSRKNIEKIAEIRNEELTLLAILVDHPHLFSKAEQLNMSNLLTNDDLRATYLTALEMQRTFGKVNSAKLLQGTSSQLRDVVADVLLSGKFASDGDPTKALDDCVVALQRNRFQLELDEIRTEMEKARAAGDTDSIRALSLRLVEVERQIHETR